MAFLRAFALATSALVAACTVEPTQKSFTLGAGGGAGITTDASLRVVTSTQADERSIHGRVRPKSLVCAEPSPDVASALVSSLGLAVKADVAKGPVAVGAGVGLNAAAAQQVAQVAERTIAIQALRETLWRACEAFANGGISEINYTLLLARVPETIATLRYAELAGGDFGRSLATLGTSGEGKAAAEGTAEAKWLQELAIQASYKEDDSMKQTRDAERQLDSSRSEKLDAEKKLTSKQQQIDRTRDEIRTATPQNAPILERDLAEMRKEERQLNDKVQEKSAEVAERQRKVEQTRNDQQKRSDEAKVAQKLATEVKVNGSAQAAGAIPRPTTSPASVLKDMHSDFLNDDFSSDLVLNSCAVAFSNPADYSELASACRPGGTFGKLAEQITTSRASYQLQRSKNFNAEALAKTAAGVELAKSKAAQRQADAQMCALMYAAAKTDEQKGKVLSSCLKAFEGADSITISLEAGRSPAPAPSEKPATTPAATRQ